MLILGGIFMEQDIDLGIDYGAIGRRLKTARINKGMKQDEIANILDTSQSYVSAIETGEKKLGLATFIKLCRIYDVSLDYVLFDNLPMKQTLNPDFDEVVSDCNEKERRFLLLLIKEAKEIARRELKY